MIEMLSVLAPSTHVTIIRDFLMKERARCLRELRHMPRYMEQQVRHIDNALDSLQALAEQCVLEQPKRKLWAEA